MTIQTKTLIKGNAIKVNKFESSNLSKQVFELIAVQWRITIFIMIVYDNYVTHIVTFW